MKTKPRPAIGIIDALRVWHENLDHRPQSSKSTTRQKEYTTGAEMVAEGHRTQ